VVYSKAPWERVAPPAGLPYDLHWALFLGLKPGISSPLRILNGITFWRMVSALSSERTVLHGNGEEASLLWAVRKKKKFVFTTRYPEFPDFLRGVDWRQPRTWLRIFLKDPRFPALALAVRRSDALTMTSDSSRKQVMEAFGNEARRGEVVPNGVDPLALDTPLEAAERRGVLFFGRLTFAKGADLVLEAYALLPVSLRERHLSQDLKSFIIDNLSIFNIPIMTIGTVGIHCYIRHNTRFGKLFLNFYQSFQIK